MPQLSVRSIFLQVLIRFDVDGTASGSEAIRGERQRKEASLFQTAVSRPRSISSDSFVRLGTQSSCRTDKQRSRFLSDVELSHKTRDKDSTSRLSLFQVPV